MPKAGRKDTELLVEALKEVLREQGVTYRELARRVGVSEPTVKRCLASRSFGLERLGEFCAAVGVSVFDLGRRAETARADVYTLTLAQERRLVRDAALFYFFWMLAERHSLAAIKRRFRLSDARAQGYLAQLHALGLLELRAKGRFVLKVPSHVAWNADGPIDRLIVKRSVPGFLRGRFRGEHEYFRFVVGALTPRSAALFREQFAALVERVFRQAVGSDAMQPGARRTGALVAFGPLEFSLRELFGTEDAQGAV